MPVGPPADAFHNVSFDEFLSGFVVNILHVFFVIKTFNTLPKAVIGHHKINSFEFQDLYLDTCGQNLSFRASQIIVYPSVVS